MTHSRDSRFTNLHGASIGFGGADHEIAANLIKEVLGHSHTCTFDAPA